MGINITNIIFNTFPAAERFILARKSSSGAELQQVEDKYVRSVVVQMDNSRIVATQISYDGRRAVNFKNIRFVTPKFPYAKLEVIL